MPSQRLGLPAWLEEKLEKREFAGLKWLDKSKGQFVISWVHASRHGWKENQDAALFKAWAVYTGRYVEGETPNPKTWKANFRCAVNASSDISLVKAKSLCKGKNAHRVYIFSRKRKCKRLVATRNPGIRLSPVTTKLNGDIKKEKNEYERRYSQRPSRTRNRQEKENQTHYEDGDLKNNIQMDVENIKKEPESPFDLRNIKIETDDDFENQARKNCDTKLYSFKELLEKIPQFSFGRPSIALPDESNELSEEAMNGSTFVYNQELFLEKMDNELFERLAADITVGHASGDEQEYFEDILQHAVFPDSQSDSEEDPMHEIFDDSRSYRSFSGSSICEENWRMERGHEDIDEKTFSPYSSIKMPVDGSNDPFLGIGTHQNEMINALTQCLTQELI